RRSSKYAQLEQDVKNLHSAVNVPLLLLNVGVRRWRWSPTDFSRGDLEQERATMKKIFTIVAVTTSLIGGANFAFAQASDARIHTGKNDGCAYQGYSCSDWQQQNGN